MPVLTAMPLLLKRLSSRWMPIWKAIRPFCTWQNNFKAKGLKLSRIAHGVPIGSDIDFIDDRTMNRAMQNRVEL